MGDLELSILPYLYDAILFIFELSNNTDLILLNTYGFFNNNQNILLTICYINNNHFNVIYEKNKEIEIPINKICHNKFQNLLDKYKKLKKRYYLYRICQ